jgi:hypothetical protein
MRSRELALEHLARNTSRHARVAEIHVSRQRIARRAQRRQEPVERLTLATEIGEPAATLEDLNLSLEDIDRRRELRLDAARAAWVT